MNSGKNYKTPIICALLLKTLKRVIILVSELKKKNYVHKKKTLESGIYYYFIKTCVQFKIHDLHQMPKFCSK
jgi:hypothetical protein